MNERQRELLLDCLSQLYLLSQKADDYWQQVASLEWEESLSLFSSIGGHPVQIENLFGRLEQEEAEKILATLAILRCRSRSQTPGFFEIALWAAVVEVNSQSLRKEIFRTAITLDHLSRKLVGSPSDMRAKELHNYVDLAKKFVTLSKHMHPAFSHSDLPPRSLPLKKEVVG